MLFRSSTPQFDQTIQGFHTGEHLANARKQANEKNIPEKKILLSFKFNKKKNPKIIKKKA